MGKEFEDGTHKKEDPDTITQFADKFIVEVKHVVSYVDHLTLLCNKEIRRKTARTKLRDDMKRKAYSDYDWQKLVADGTLRKLQVDELNKYFRHHKFEKDIFRKCKKEKILMIIAHLTNNALAIQSRKVPTYSRNEEEKISDEEEDRDDESDDDVDIIRELLDNMSRKQSEQVEEEDTSSGEEEYVARIILPCGSTTRSARRVRPRDIQDFAYYY